MKEANEVRLTGAVDRIRQITTRTGAAMAEIILKVRQDRFRITALGNVAEHLLDSCAPGDRLTVTGTLATSSWKDESTGEWRNSFSITAWCAEIHGDKIAYQRQGKPASTPWRRDELPMAGPDDPF